MLASLLDEEEPANPGEESGECVGFCDRLEGPGLLYESRNFPRVSNGGAAVSAYSSGDSTTGGYAEEIDAERLPALRALITDSGGAKCGFWR